MIDYWWQVGNQTFSNRHRADLYSEETGLYNRFETNHQLYKSALADKSFDINKDYSLEFIHQLREEHDHIRLFYTGGFDSHCILKYFLDNNIQLDETATVWCGLNKNDTNSTSDKEYKLSAEPYIQQHRHKIGQITYLHNGLNEYKKFYSNPDWMLDVPGGYPYARLFTSVFPWFDEYNHSADCNIVGKEKPYLIKLGESWYLTTMDSLYLDWIGLPNKVLFWLDPRNIKAMIKDAILYRSFIQKNFQLTQNQIFNVNYKGQQYVDACLAINRPMVPNDITGKNNMSKADGKKNWCNQKDKEFFNELVEQNQYSLLTDYFASWKRYSQILPEYKNENTRYPTGKFPWYINIDTLEYFESSEMDISLVFEN